MSDHELYSEDDSDSSRGLSEDIPHETTIPEARQITLARARDFRALLVKYIRRYVPDATESEPEATEPPSLKGSHAALLPLLRLIPFVLALLFVLSFFWDFPGMSVTVFGTFLTLDGVLRIVAVSGLIGFNQLGCNHDVIQSSQGTPFTRAGAYSGAARTGNLSPGTNRFGRADQRGDH